MVDAIEGIAAVEQSPDGKVLYLHDLALPRYDCPPNLRHLVPRADPNFTYDPSALEVLYAVALAEQHAHPLLIDGYPGTTKTSGVLELYRLLNRPLFRLNCRSKSDTTDFVGHFVPNDQDLRKRLEIVLAQAKSTTGSPGKLPDEASQLIHSMQQGRVLSLQEMQRLAELCGMESQAGDWRWKDGAVPFCMTEGVVLLLDEADLAPQEVLQSATNSVLEIPPSLTIPEHENEVIRRCVPDEEISNRSVRPLHPLFRMYATRNPMDDARLPFGLPYKDRWIRRLVVGEPNAQHYFDRLDRRVFGRQPGISFRDCRYASHDCVHPPRREYAQTEALSREHTVLAQIGNVRSFLNRLSAFQESAARAAHSKEIGRSGLDTQEGLLFTQRSLEASMAFLERHRTFDRGQNRVRSTADDPIESIQLALRLYYLDRCADPGDRRKLQDMLHALELTRENWGVHFTEGYEELPGRQPEIFLSEVWGFLQANGLAKPEHQWSWHSWPTSGTRDGKWISMEFPHAAQIPPELIDTTADHERIWKDGRSTGYRVHIHGEPPHELHPGHALEGFPDMLKYIGDRKVRSLVCPGYQGTPSEWYLRCIGDVPPHAVYEES